MKILDVFARKPSLQAAQELFFATWHTATRTVIRKGPRTVSWIVCADLEGHGRPPRAIVAGGVCDTRAQADDAMRRWFERWTVTGPAGMVMVGRAWW